MIPRLMEKFGASAFHYGRKEEGSGGNGDGSADRHRAEDRTDTTRKLTMCYRGIIVTMADMMTDDIWDDGGNDTQDGKTSAGNIRSAY